MTTPIQSNPDTIRQQTAGKASSPAPESVGAHLRSAGSHLQDAARKAAGSVPEANAAAARALKDGYADLAPDLAAAKREAVEAGSAAAADAERKWQAMLGQGKSALERSEQFVRERPLASIGIAVAGGFLLSRLLRR